MLSCRISHYCRLKLLPAILIISMLCLPSCGESVGKEGLLQCLDKKRQTGVDGLLDSNMDVVSTKGGRFVFYCCADDSVHVLCLTASYETLYTFFSYKGGYRIETVDSLSGSVDFTVSSSGYGHSDDDFYRIRIADGASRCVWAMKANDYNMYSSDPEKIRTYSADIIGDSVVNEISADYGEGSEENSTTAIHAMEPTGIFYTDMVNVDTLYVRSRERVIAIPIDRTTSYIGLHEYECIYVDNVWYMRDRANKFGQEHPFSQMYSVNCCYTRGQSECERMVDVKIGR